LLDKTVLDAYEALDPANGRMRGLMVDVFENQLDQNLWIPPALLMLPFSREVQRLA